MDDNIEVIAIVNEEHLKKIKYSCTSCKSTGETKPLPCIIACESGVLKHP